MLTGAKLNAAQRLEVHRELNTAIAKAVKQSAHEQQQIAQNNASTDIELAKIAYQQRKSELDQEVAAGRMTKQQELTILLGYLTEVEKLELDALNKQEVNYDKDSLAFARAENEKRVIAARTKAQIEQLQAELAKDDEKIYGTTLSRIQNAEKQMIQGLFTGTRSFQDVLFNVLDQVAEKWLETEVTTLTAHLMTETQKTAGTEVGVATRTAIEKIGHDESAASSAASGSAQIMNDAYKAAAGAYQAVVGDGPLGPVLAPIAAGAAFTAVAAFDVLTSAAGGQWQVAYDGQLTELHKDEMVLPAWAATPIRSMIQTNAIAPSPSAGTAAPVNVQFNVNAIDAQGVSEFFRKNMTAISRGVAREWHLNQSLRPAY